MTSKVRDNRIGIFAFDPGGTTGVGWALLEPRSTVKTTLRHADIHTDELRGDWMDQARALRDLWIEVSVRWEGQGVSQKNTYLVREDFNLYKFGSSDKKGVYPIWISAALHGLLDDEGTKIHSQTPAEAKRYATNERLKRWGVYIAGSEHKRDVVRHIAFKLNRIL